MVRESYDLASNSGILPAAHHFFCRQFHSYFGFLHGSLSVLGAVRTSLTVAASTDFELLITRELAGFLSSPLGSGFLHFRPLFVVSPLIARVPVRQERHTRGQSLFLSNLLTFPDS